MTHYAARISRLTPAILSLSLILAVPPVMGRSATTATAQLFSGTSSRHVELTVIAIEAGSNTVILHRPDGTVIRVQVNRSIGDVRCLKIGDHVNVKYARALLLHADKVDSKGIRERVETEATSPLRKGKAKSIHTVQIVATVKSIDARNRMVTLRGTTQTVTLVASSALPLGDLKVGDSIRADYIEATVIQITRDGDPLQ